MRPTHVLWIGFLFFFSLFFLSVSANNASNNITWVPGFDSAYSLRLNYSLCPTALGNTSISATVTGNNGNTVVDANVFATIFRPDSTSVDVNFTNTLSGTYSYTYNFDLNGEYLIQARAFKHNVTPGDANGYVYLGDLDFDIVFLNNDFSIAVGALGTIQNIVYNEDGNKVYDVNANTSILLNGSVVDANRAMSQAANGEFSYNFFGPSPAGNYDVTTVIQCGNRYDSNTAGGFTTTSSSTGSTGSTGTTGGTGGGGGGGGSSRRAQIIDIALDPAPSRNQPSELSATLLNLTTTINDYLLEYKITLPSGTIVIGEKTVLAVAPYLPTKVILDPAYTPTELGTMIVDVSAKSLNRQTTFATLQRAFPVQGTHLITVDLSTPSTKSAQGLTFPFTINLSNGGDFDETNIEVAWHIMDPNGVEYSQSTFTTTLNKGDTASFPYAAFIPLNAVLGLHALQVEITAYGQTQTREVMFEVSSPNDYYAQVIADLELRADQLEDKLKDLQQRGFDVSDEAQALLDIQTDLARAKGTFLAGKFENLNTQLLKISEDLTKLAAMIDLVGQQAPLLSRDGLAVIGYAAGILLLVGLAYLLWKKLHTHVAPTNPLLKPYPHLPWFMRFMRLEKCYIPLRERKKQKRKALISRLLGLE